MTFNRLKIKLSKIASISVIKEGVVFTLLMTGEGLTEMDKYNSIMSSVLEYTKGKYGNIEAMRNEETYFLLILKPAQP